MTVRATGRARDVAAALAALDRYYQREAAKFDRATAYRRRRDCRGRGTLRGIGLARAYLRRWRLSSPMFKRGTLRVRIEAAA